MRDDDLDAATLAAIDAMPDGHRGPCDRWPGGDAPPETFVTPRKFPAPPDRLRNSVNVGKVLTDTTPPRTTTMTKPTAKTAPKPAAPKKRAAPKPPTPRPRPAKPKPRKPSAECVAKMEREARAFWKIDRGLAELFYQLSDRASHALLDNNGMNYLTLAEEVQRLADLVRGIAELWSMTKRPNLTASLLDELTNNPPAG